jgi:hypothetical protein
MFRLIGAILLVSLMPASSSAQVAPAETAVQRVTVEYYYRIKWGSLDEFKRLYERNHAPLLRELQKSGFIVAMKMDEPFTHLAGGVRWDLRVTITYRDAASAMDVDKPGQKLWEDATARLYPDKKKFEEEEARRFGLLEDHWDVVIG